MCCEIKLKNGNADFENIIQNGTTKIPLIDDFVILVNKFAIVDQIWSLFHNIACTLIAA